MAVLGWIIIGLFGLAYLFGAPLLLGGSRRNYLRELGSWLGFLFVAALVVFLLLFAVWAISGA